MTKKLSQNEGRMNEERLRMNEEWWRMNDEGWWFQAVEGFADKQTKKQMDEQTFVIVESLSQLKTEAKCKSRLYVVKVSSREAVLCYKNSCFKQHYKSKIIKLAFSLVKSIVLNFFQIPADREL